MKELEEEDGWCEREIGSQREIPRGKGGEAYRIIQRKRRETK